jgi:DsbC/DsbD-like thiol-disulfide interchange protein
MRSLQELTGTIAERAGGKLNLTERGCATEMRRTLNRAERSESPFRAALVCGLAGMAMVCAAFAHHRSGAGIAQSQVSAPHVDVQLLSEQKSIQLGHTLWVGLQFQLPSGWHIYWQNPGDSGEPPKVKWTLPAGLHAGGLQWPAPHWLESPSLVDYGYPDGVLLLATIRVDANAAPSSAVPLQADVRYLVCREICVPEKANVTMSLPAQSGAAAWNADAHTLFEKTRAQLPKPPPAAWRIRAQSQGDYFVLSIAMGKSAGQGVFFPLDPGQIENAAPQEVSATPSGIEIRLRKSDQLLKPVARLRGVVEFGAGRAYAVDAPVAEASASGSGHEGH